MQSETQTEAETIKRVGQIPSDRRKMKDKHKNRKTVRQADKHRYKH